MKTRESVAARLVGGALLLLAFGACDGPGSLGPTQAEQDARSSARPAQCTPVTLLAVYSGPPARDPGVIDINDQFVYVDILSIDSYIPRPVLPTANDLRIGPSHAAGTPAESFQILDINSDGVRDIRIAFSKSQLVANGHLTLATTLIEVWGLDRTDDQLYCGSFEVRVIQPPPPAGQDVVVLNDINPFDLGAMGFAGTDNHDFVRNLVTFTSDGPRNSGTVVMWDRGRAAACGPSPNGNDECNNTNMATTRTVIAGEGFTFLDVMSTSGTLTDLPGNVKSIWLWTPRTPYTNAEINALKAFASEGGRIVFIGEWDAYYGAQGIATQNDFLEKMGAVMRNTGGAVNCGYTTLPSGSLVAGHQVMTGLSSLRIACASVIEPGPQDFLLFYDTSVTQVLAGVARIDTTPISGPERLPSVSSRAIPARPGLNPGSASGQ
jgi:hypothetical protein